jgi:exosortase/archaeosortase family protein
MYRLGRSEIRSPSNFDGVFATALLLAILAASFVGYRFSIGILATVFACYLLLSRADHELKAANTVLLALSVHLFWGPIVFQYFTPELLRADAALVGGILNLARPDIVWNGTTFYTTPDFAVSLVGACSSFHNLSTAVLVCVAATMFMRTDWARRDIPRLLAAVAIMVFMNDTRICLLAWSPSAYEFWHNGAGAPVLDFLTTAILLIIAFWGTAWRNDRA